MSNQDMRRSSIAEDEQALGKPLFTRPFECSPFVIVNDLPRRIKWQYYSDPADSTQSVYF